MQIPFVVLVLLHNNAKYVIMYQSNCLSQSLSPYDQFVKCIHSGEQY